MPNIQQPEMRRSGHNPLVQDSAKARAEHARAARQARGHVPEDQISPYGPTPAGEPTANAVDEPAARAAGEPDAITHGGPRHEHTFRAEDAALITLEASGLIHRYIRTGQREDHDGRRLRVYTYDGEVRAGAR